jgi:SNF2 family DNA or RNA helicase
MIESQLIFSFFKHPAFGLSMDAYLVELLENKSFSYHYKRVVFELIENYDYTFSETDRKILKKIGELNPKNIEKQFNKKPLKSVVFLEKLAQDKEQLKLLSGYFDRRISACLDLLKGQHVYWKERPSDHPGMISFTVEEKPADVIYSFEKGEDGIRYNLEMKHLGKLVNLQKTDSIIISNAPCWVRNGNSIYHFNDGTDGNKLSPFLKKSELQIPDKLADQFLESFMLKASRRFDVRYTGFNVITNPTRVFAKLSIAPDLDKGSVMQLGFQYDNFQLTAAQDQEVLVQLQRSPEGHKLLRFNRDKEFEQTQTARLESFGLKRKQPSWYLPETETEKIWTPELLLEWVREEHVKLAAAGFEVDATWEGKQFSIDIPFVKTSEIKEGTDWFDVLIIVQLGEFEIPFIKFRKNILEKNRNFKLPDGRFFLLPLEWFAHYYDLFEFGETTATTLRLQKQHHGLLHGHPLMNGELTGGIQEDKKSIYTTNNQTEYPLPKGLTATLRDYQIKGFDWLCRLAENRLGACLADDMGLGKTLQVIAVLQRIKENNPEPVEIHKAGRSPKNQLDLFADSSSAITETSIAPSLLVMAPSLIYNWQNELKKFAPDLKVYTHIGQRRTTEFQDFYGSDIVLTTYGVIRNDVNMLRQAYFDYIVLDESQLIKNSHSVSFQSVKQLKAKQRIVLTGTPVENSLSDLWSQLTFLQPGLLGSFSYFKNDFVIPIEQQNDIKKLEKLRKIIQPFILRRTKEEVAPELPLLTRTIHYCEMGEEQRTYYEEQKSKYRSQILENISKEGIQKSQILILRGLTQLRKIAIHPILENPDYTGRSAKFDEVIGRMATIRKQGKKVLLFSQFVKHLNLYQDCFIENGTDLSILNGQVPQNQRAGVIQQFDNHEGHRAFLIQLKTGGSGLNLTQADNVFLLDPWWNPASEEQAIARSHRMGQHQPVFAWRFITKHTIEEKILKLQGRKTKLALDIIDQTNTFGKITEEELQELFG